MGDWFENLSPPQAIVICVAIIGFVALMVWPNGR
jgi:hypothetical protein